MDWDIFCSRQRNIPNLKRHKTSAASVRLWWNAHWNAKIVQWQLLYPIENASSKCKCWHSLMDIWKKKNTIFTEEFHSVFGSIALHCTHKIWQQQFDGYHIYSIGPLVTLNWNRFIPFSFASRARQFWIGTRKMLVQCPLLHFTRWAQKMKKNRWILQPFHWNDTLFF